MNFQQYPVTKSVEIDGQIMVVPINTECVAINRLGTVEAWTVKPHCNEGHWYDLNGEVRPVIVGVAEDASILCVELYS